MQGVERARRIRPSPGPPERRLQRRSRCCRAVGADEPLVRSYLKHFFLEDASTKEYEPYIDDVWLRHLFAETKIEIGQGDPEEWASKLPPELFRALKDRIDIDFAFTNKTDYAADEVGEARPATSRTCRQLLVKVFEVNTRTSTARA